MNVSSHAQGPIDHNRDDSPCQVHPGASAAFICNECKAPLCEACAKRAGAYHIRTCSICGFLCSRLADYVERTRIEADSRQPLGLADLSIALRYPFQRGLSVFLLAVIYGASHFSLAFFALGGVGLLLGGIGGFPAFVADSMMFAYVSRIIARVETGRAAGVEDFDESSLLAEFPDVMLQGLATYISLAWPGIIGLVFHAGVSTAIGLAVAWAVFYYPASMLVRAVSKSFWSIANPLAGITIIVKLGTTYLKLFGIYLSIMVIAGIPLAYVAIHTVEAAFSLPMYLMLGVFFGPPVFYLNLVLAVLIGRAMFKNSEQFEQLR
jgi:hypothetical protein